VSVGGEGCCDEDHFMECETKLVACDDALCASLWVGMPHSFVYSLSVGESRGLLFSWDCSVVEVWSTVSLDHAVMTHGQFIRSNEEFHLVNVYAPCDNGAKQILWDTLAVLLQPFVGKNICICGNFNVVHLLEEHRYVRLHVIQSNIAPFNRFIDDNSLVDLPLYGRKYTWYKGDDSSMSRLEEFLLSENWCLVWPSCMQVAQLRGLLDHCPLLLTVSKDDWGPWPSRMLKCWCNLPSYKQFVVD